MKIKATPKFNLVVEGKDNWENTDEFNKKVDKIKRELLDKYSLVLSTEKNWFMRLFIKSRLWLEVKKRIDELSSWKNLHVASQWH
jgi:hypothetical protein